MRDMPRLLLTALFLAAHGVAAAQAIPIDNHGFELPAIPAGTFDTDAPPPPGWSVYGGAVDFGFRTVGVLDPTGTTLYPGGAPEGENVGVVFLLDDVGDQTAFAGIEAGLEQTLDATLEFLSVYTLTVEVGNIGNDATPPNDQFEFAGFPGYRVALVAGGVEVDSEGSLLPAEGAFLTETLSVVVGASHPQAGAQLVVRLVNENAAPGIEVNFDDVRLERRALGAGEVPDGARVPGPPLVLAKSAGDSIALDWSASCTGDADYSIYSGAIGDITSHVPVVCSTGGATQATFGPPAGSAFFLVVPVNASHEGGYGSDAAGTPRSPSSAPCRTQTIEACP